VPYWANRFGTFCILENNQYQLFPHTYNTLVAVGAKYAYSSSESNALEGLQLFIDAHPHQWLFGHIGYGVPQENKPTPSHAKANGFADVHFFVPEIVMYTNENELTILAENPKEIWEALLQFQVEDTENSATDAIHFNSISKNEYVQTIEKLKQHILQGDCYEINFCQQFCAKEVTISPIELFKKLNVLTPHPFSALYKQDDQWLISASPERFIKKEGSTIFSQPMKGTAARDATHEIDSLANLLADSKEKAENVMIVDLVRNDLSKICKEASVRVTELFGIQVFPQVYQMVSTIAGELLEGITFREIIDATFPMGSMTGAPKIKVMELINRYENFNRGLFSGTLGYISPEGDFDFNVVIRSIFYQKTTRTLSYMVGSGITFNCIPENEWEECLLKAQGIRQAFI